MIARRSLALVALVPLLAISACTGSDDPAPGPRPTGSASASTPTPTAGDQADTDDFTLTLPIGWQDQDVDGPLLFALGESEPDTFSTTLNVVADSTLVTAKTPDDLTERLVQIAKDAAEADDSISTPDPGPIRELGEIDVDGEAGARISHLIRIDSVMAQAEQIAVTHDDQGYLITFAFPTSASGKSRDELVDEVMSTWKWTAPESD